MKSYYAKRQRGSISCAPRVGERAKLSSRDRHEVHSPSTFVKNVQARVFRKCGILARAVSRSTLTKLLRLGVQECIAKQ